MKTKKQEIESKLIVGLYGDTGVAPNSFFLLQKLLSPYYTVMKLKAPDIIFQKWPVDMKVLVIPGGADVSYHQKLQGEGCANIRTFVEEGGIYVGVCAGSYFAADEIYFTYGNGNIIQGARELGFFKGRVVGPAFGDYVEGTHASAKLVPVILRGKSALAYFNGGGVFEGAQESEVLGIYQGTKLPMAVKCNVGKGYALLCAVHPEYDAEFLASIEAFGLVDYSACNEVRDWFLRMLSQVVLNSECASIP